MNDKIQAISERERERDCAGEEVIWNRSHRLQEFTSRQHLKVRGGAQGEGWRRGRRHGFDEVGVDWLCFYEVGVDWLSFYEVGVDWLSFYEVGMD